ncbi:MAG: TonB-dependent receptor [Rhodospirillaceae bacterium]|nr:TonB-dependent receptor [Rhodospirillaceae bacterium]
MRGKAIANRNLRAIFLLAAVVCAAPVMSLAQDQGVLEEIVVTAQKRTENLQTVPLAITAYSGDFLEKQGIISFQDLKSHVPGFIFDEYSPGQPRYYIRGIGNNLQSGSVDEDVGIFVDGVYLDRPAMGNTEFMDIERIEVLRGPQGTLFGRNVVGGAISFHTRKPIEEFRAGGSVSYGNYSQIAASGFVSGQIADNAFASVAASARNRDGYAFNTTTGNDVDDTQYGAARATLRILPSDSLETIFRADVSRRRGTGGWWVLYGRGLQTAPSEIATPRRNAHDVDDGVNDVDNHGFTLEANWESDIGTFTSLSAYRMSIFSSRVNLTPPKVAPGLDPAAVVGNLSNILFIRDFTEKANQASQELRLTSPSGEDLKWVVGAFYHHSNVFFSHSVIYKLLTRRSEGRSGSLTDSSTDAYALFANASYDLSDKLSLQTGVRWSRDEKEAATTATGVPTGGRYFLNGVALPVGAGYSVSGEKAWSAVTPAFSLNYQVTPDHFLYATVSRGFKSGGFPSAQDDARATQTPFDPEFAWNYEVGAKTEWFENRMRLNVAAFWMDYTNLQVRGLIPPVDPALPGTRLFLNAGKTTSKGIETELNVAPMEGLNLFASHTYLKTRINKTDGTAEIVLRVGDQLVKAPHHKLFVGGSYTVPLSDAMNATLQADYSHTSSYFPQLPNLPAERIPSQKVLGASLQFEPKDGNWSVDLWSKNLTDELHINSLTTVVRSTYGFWDPPRTYGITLRFRS